MAQNEAAGDVSRDGRITGVMRTKPPKTSGTFDPADYLRHISADDHLRVVLGAHLYIEAVLGELIERVIPYPEEINVAGRRFDERLRWASALGILHPDEVPAYKAVNDLRNEMAHGLAEFVNVGQVDDLIKRLTAFQLQVVATNIGGRPLPGKHLLDVLVTLFVLLKARLDQLPDGARLVPGNTWRARMDLSQAGDSKPTE
jgi:hypothetical protein